MPEACDYSGRSSESARIFPMLRMRKLGIEICAWIWWHDDDDDDKELCGSVKMPFCDDGRQKRRVGDLKSDVMRARARELGPLPINFSDVFYTVRAELFVVPSGRREREPVGNWHNDNKRLCQS